MSQISTDYAEAGHNTTGPPHPTRNEMNITPEQIPDEVVEAALNASRAVDVVRTGALTKAPYEQRIRAALAAALPVLLGEPVAFSIKSADGQLSRLGFFPMGHYDAVKHLAVLREGWHYVFAYHVDEITRETPNAHP